MFPVLPQTLSCAAPHTLILKIRIMPTVHFSFISFIDISRQKALGSMKCALSLVKDYQCYICFPEFIRFPDWIHNYTSIKLASFFFLQVFPAGLCLLFTSCKAWGLQRKKSNLISDTLFQGWLYFFHYLIARLSCLRGCAGIQKSMLGFSLVFSSFWLTQKKDGGGL